LRCELFRLNIDKAVVEPNAVVASRWKFDALVSDYQVPG
jgi:hypothetical protein